MKPIAVGDLVMVIKENGHCKCRSRYLGTVFRVSKIIQLTLRCTKCGVTWGPEEAAQDAADGLYAAMWRLKRIPPLEKLDGERAEENLKEPA